MKNQSQFQNRVEIIIFAILIFIFSGIYFTLSQIFLNLIFALMIIANILLVVASRKSIHKQSNYLLDLTLFTAAFYMMGNFYLHWNLIWIVPIVYLGVTFLVTLLIEDSLSWPAKLSRDIFLLYLIWIYQTDGILLPCFSICVALIFISEETSQIKKNKVPAQYSEKEYKYYYFSWFGLIFLLIIEFANSSAMSTFLSLLGVCILVYLKLIFLNPKNHYFQMWPYFTGVILSAQALWLYKQPSIPTILAAIGIVFVWFLGDFLYDLNQHHDKMEFRLKRYTLLVIWMVISGFIIYEQLGIPLLYFIFIGLMFFFLESNKEIRILYALLVNVFLILFLLPLPLDSILLLLNIVIKITLKEFAIILLIITEFIILCAYFLQISQRFMEAHENFIFIGLLANKIILSGLIFYYAFSMSAIPTNINLYLLIQIELAFGLILIGTLAILKHSKFSSLGYYLLHYSAVNIIVNVAIHQIIYPKEQDLIYQIIILSAVFLLTWIINAQNPTDYQPVKESTHEISSVAFAGFAIIMIWFVVNVWDSYFVLLSVYLVLCLGLRLLHRDSLVCEMYTLGAQALWILLLLEVYLDENFFYLAIVSVGGLIAFLTIDLFNRSNTHHLGIFTWTSYLFVPVALIAIMEFLPKFWFISPIIVLVLLFGYIKLESSALGGLKSFQSMLHGFILMLLPTLALTFYYSTLNAWLVLPPNLAILQLLTYPICGFIELLLIVLFIKRPVSRDLLAITDQRIKKEAKANKSEQPTQKAAPVKSSS